MQVGPILNENPIFQLVLTILSNGKKANGRSGHVLLYNDRGRRSITSVDIHNNLEQRNQI